MRTSFNDQGMSRQRRRKFRLRHWTRRQTRWRL